jgi:hypothetical protein
MNEGQIQVFCASGTTVASKLEAHNRIVARRRSKPNVRHEDFPVYAIEAAARTWPACDGARQAYQCAAQLGGPGAKH